MKRFLVKVIVLLCFSVYSQGQYNPFQPWMLEGVYKFNIQHQGDTTRGLGTAFVIVHEGKKYVVTAKHTISDKVKLFQNHNGKLPRVCYSLSKGDFSQSFCTPFYGFSEKDIDIAVAYIGMADMAIEPISADALQEFRSVSLGAHVVFVGYPELLSSDNRHLSVCTQTIDGCFPVVKTGRISAVNTVNVGSDVIIDAMNISGFSGSPVYAYDSELGQFILFALIKSYIPQSTQIKGKGIDKESGMIFANSGLTLASMSKYIFEIIEYLQPEP